MDKMSQTKDLASLCMSETPSQTFYLLLFFFLFRLTTKFETQRVTTDREQDKMVIHTHACTSQHI